MTDDPASLLAQLERTAIESERRLLIARLATLASQNPDAFTPEQRKAILQMAEETAEKEGNP